MRTGGHCRTVDREISRFPSKELLHMPGSSTTPGRSDLAMVRPKRVAFRARNSVGTRGLAFAAQWLAYALPYRRFVGVLTDANARLGADVDRYSFIVVDLHHLLLAGLPAHFESYMPSHAVGSPYCLCGTCGHVTEKGPALKAAGPGQQRWRHSILAEGWVQLPQQVKSEAGGDGSRTERGPAADGAQIPPFRILEGGRSTFSFRLQRQFGAWKMVPQPRPSKTAPRASRPANTRCSDFRRASSPFEPSLRRQSGLCTRYQVCTNRRDVARVNEHWSSLYG